MDERELELRWEEVKQARRANNLALAQLAVTHLPEVATLANDIAREFGGYLKTYMRRRLATVPALTETNTDPLHPNQ